MIEKLKTINPYDETEIDMDANSVAGLVYENTPLVQKINELVDAVNVLQAQVAILEEHAHPTATTEPTETPTISKMENVDPYTEQRKWAGKLCWFWEGDPNDKIVDVLSHIDTARLCPFIQCDHQIGWTNCEPVKPDDDIIYKGE